MKSERWISNAILVLVALFLAAEVDACSCVGGEGVERAFARADAVFAGVVVRIDDPRTQAGTQDKGRPVATKNLPSHLDPEYGRKITFRVLQWWKGDRLDSELMVRTGFGGGDCGYHVEAGKSYLVYAHRKLNNDLEFGICGRTTALLCASEDLAGLGHPIKAFEPFDTQSLIEREQPYAVYGRSCVTRPLLIGERNLAIDPYCRLTVRGVIGVDGIVREFEILERSSARACPASLDAVVRERVAEWRFRPATFEGKPVEALFQAVSVGLPINEAEHARHLKEQAERKPQ